MKVSNCCNEELLTGIGRLVCSKCNKQVTYKNCIDMNIVTEATKTTVIPYIISHQDVNKFYEILQEVRLDSNKKILKEVIQATPLMIQVSNTGMIKGMANAQLIIVPSAYIEFECTEEHAKEFRYKQTKLIG
jgi:hypothetical protein